MANVPPARRENHQQSSSDASSAALRDPKKNLDKTLGDLKISGSSKSPSTALFADIHNYYWASQSNEGDDTSSPASLPTVMSRSTLNGSVTHRDKLQYIMLFKDANPRWVSDGIIFVKSSLDLLPGYEQAKDAGFPGTVSQESSVSKKTFSVPAIDEVETIEIATIDSQYCDEKQKVSDTMVVIDEVDAHKVEPAEDQGKTVEDTQKQQPELLHADLHNSTATSYNHQDNNRDNLAITKGDAEVSVTLAHNSCSPDLSQYDTGPIAIFEQAEKRQDGHFRFAGYYKITNLQYLPPQSADLYRMLEQKFTTLDRFGRPKQRIRSAASWNASMSLMWAVIKMERDEEANAHLAPPNLGRSRTAEA